MLESPSDDGHFQPATQKSRCPFNGTAVKNGSTLETTDIAALTQRRSFHQGEIPPEVLQTLHASEERGEIG